MCWLIFLKSSCPGVGVSDHSSYNTVKSASYAQLYYHYPIRDQLAKRNHQRLLSFELPLFFYHMCSHSQKIFKFRFLPDENRHTAFSCNKYRIEHFLVSISNFFLLFCLSIISRVHLLPQTEGKWVFDRPCQGRMSQWRYIVCALPFLVCSD